MIVPSQPAPMDLSTLIETVQTAIAPTKVLYRVLLTKVDPRSLNEAMEAQQSLMDSGIPAFNCFIRGYKSQERAPLEGVPITKMKGKNAGVAASDYKKVVDELLREWKVMTKRKKLADLVKQETGKAPVGDLEKQTSEVANHGSNEVTKSRYLQSARVRYLQSYKVKRSESTEVLNLNS